MVRATFKGTGSKRILLIAHMDTVYLKGMLEKQPFRIEGNKAYGLGIADDKQGVAMVMHLAVAMLKQLNFNEYGTLTVLVNADEEISSPGARQLHQPSWAPSTTPCCPSRHSRIERQALAGHQRHRRGGDPGARDGLACRLGARAGVNALYELSHQVLQMRDLSDPQTGVKMNWTISQSGTNRNVIPATAKAEADVRVLRVADYDRIEAAVSERSEEAAAARVQGHGQVSNAAVRRWKHRGEPQGRPRTRRRSTARSAASWWSTTSPKAAAPMPPSPR
jgi:glutamate carboxypeptidase